MPIRRRLDVELVRRHLASSREHAQELIASGAVVVDGFVAEKSSRQVVESASIVVAATSGDSGELGRGQWVSRGAFKLLGALEDFEPRGLNADGRVCLDAGASTGGFTQVLLHRGAHLVHAVDVGYGQLAWTLRNHPDVHVMERTNIRELKPEDLSPPPEFVVADLSFISLRLVLPVLTALAVPRADMVLMVKPQFEVGRENLGAGGVVRQAESRIQAVWDVACVAAHVEWPAIAITASRLPGPSGNVEYFIWLKHRLELPRTSSTPIGFEDIERAVQEGPQ